MELVILLIIGVCLIISGLMENYQRNKIYTDDEGRTGNIKQWKSYAKTLGTRPMAREIELLNRDDFIKELATCYNIFLKEI